jgi:glyoxylase-like metal-dependent hydrolase (beta-lactamase superfamily II)/predicted ester cyclase
VAPTAEIAKRYFAALAAHDLEAAGALWRPGAIDRLVGVEDLVAPQGLRRYFGDLFAAFPDFAIEVLETTTGGSRTVVRWRATGTFAGPGTFQGYAPNHVRVELEGCDVVSVGDGLIDHNDAYIDTGDIARQLGLLPPIGSRAEARLAALANLRTRAVTAVAGSAPERVADGVWLVRGGFPLRTMNVFLLEDGDRVTVFDAGISAMAAPVGAAGARLGGIGRVVLGHADPDHRGAAPALGAPVYCHADECAAAAADGPLRDYYDLRRLRPYARRWFTRVFPAWDGGPVEVAGTVAEGDEVAAFRVIELPGHAPGLIGLFRESDRLALVSDAVYTMDVQTGRKTPARLPHPAFTQDAERARASIRKLADLRPATVWAGHADPVTGDAEGQLRAAADAPLPG